MNGKDAGRWIGVAIVAWVAWKGYRLLAGIKMTAAKPVMGGVLPMPGEGTGQTAGVDPSTGRALY